jgi:hypothetical protein
MKMKIHLIILLAMTVGINCYCNPSKTKHFHGICADGENNHSGLRNPERGLRLEVALNIESSDVANPSSITARLESEAKKYASDNITLVQTYFYLSGIEGKPLEQRHFDVMQIFFDKLRDLGMKAVLRFAYEGDFMGRAKSGPAAEDIHRHIRQLKPFLETNKDVILVLQAGFIGAWGEWHSSVHGLENSKETKKKILEWICDLAPEGRMVQVRVPEYKNLLKEDAKRYNKLSFHDDFIVIKPHVWDGNMSEGTPAYEQIVKESPSLLVDGELPWGFWSVNNDPDDKQGGWLIEGEQAARRLFLQHFTSLSAIHNYKEKDTTEKFSMLYWKETPINEAFLSENKMPVSDNYFLKKDGSKAERNVFDYVCDHLGYRIELREIKTNSEWKKGKNNPVEISLVNRGFSTLFNEHPVYLVLIDSWGKVRHTTLTGANVNDWQPYNPQDATKTPLVHRITASILLPETLPHGVYRLGLWIPDASQKLMYNSLFAIQCANSDSIWITNPDGYGINCLTDITL